MPTVAQGSYKLETLQTPDVELDRLKMQAEFIQQEEIQTLVSLGAGPGARILDLGCGAGQLSRRLADLVGPSGRVLGVDGDPDIMPKEDGQANLSFMHGLAGQLPASLGTFDLVYARFLLQHVPDPVQVLENAARLLAPGGKIVVVDSDDGLVLSHPVHPELDRMLKLAREKQTAQGGDRTVGRKLPLLMKQAGLELQSYQTRMFNSVTTAFPLLFRIAMGYKASLLGQGRQLEDLCTTLDTEATKGRFIFTTGVCVAIGARA